MKRRRGSALRRRYGHTQGGRTIPDLDSLGQDGLMTFWHVYHRAGPRLAQHLFGKKFPNYTRAASSLAGYASNRATAMSCAARGDQSGAEMYNGIADRIARDLPAEALEIAGRPGMLPAQTREAIKHAVTGERFQTERAILKGWKR